MNQDVAVLASHNYTFRNTENVLYVVFIRRVYNLFCLLHFDVNDGRVA